MNTCQSCGHTPCTCAPAVLSGIQLVNSLLSNPTIDGMTANGGTATNLSLVGAQLDCTSRGCTAGPGVCNDGIATNAQVCAEVAAAISSSNPAFCDAVASCIVSDPTTLCAGVATCIATAPGIINSNGAFGIGARATTALYGVARYATLAEFENANCLLAIDPCTLAAFWNAPNLSSAMWAAFSNAVGAALPVSSAFCAAVFTCGAAPLASPAFGGTPTAPTAAPGTNNTQIATTAFVQATVTLAVSNAISSAISSSNPAFCTAVAGCITTPPTPPVGGVVVARGRFIVDSGNVPSAGPSGYFVGCAPILFNIGQVTVQLNAPQPGQSYAPIANGLTQAGVVSNTTFIFQTFPDSIVDFVVVGG